MISKRLPDISGHNKYFDKVAAISNEVLKNSVCNETFKFSPTIPITRHRGKILFGSTCHHLAVMLKQMQENFF